MTRSKDLESYIKNDEMNETSEEDTSLLMVIIHL